MFFVGLNEESMRMINNIVDGFRNHPVYSSYTIKSYLYDMRCQSHALEVSRNDKLINLFLFYPSIHMNGKIWSIAIYGRNLEGHYKAIKSSMKIFGLKVDSVSIDSGGIEDFVDVYISEY